MRAKMEQYKVDVHVDGKSGYSTMVTASSTTEANNQPDWMQKAETDLQIRKYLQDQQ